MEFLPLARSPDAFQAPLSEAEILAMCVRVLGSDWAPESAVELGHGSYNNTHRLERGASEPVVLRVAPAPGRQFRCERQMMRNEYATAPFLAELGSLVPRVLGGDFTHQLVDRDYMVESLLPGVSGAGALGSYPRSLWPGFYAQMGTIARRIHLVRGEGFGPVPGPLFARWSEALLASLNDAIADLEDCSLAGEDVRQLADYIERQQSAFDEIRRPQLLHGDLWTGNVMLEAGSATPKIVGVFDSERASWGDPMADWVIFRIDSRQSQAEQDAFWRAYGDRQKGRTGALRQEVYRARRLVEVRLERFRVGNEAGLEETYAQLGAILESLRSG